jgi:hypothetical protein
MTSSDKHSSQTRDAALRRLTSANRWLIAASVALTGILAEVAAQAFPGKRLASASAATTKRHASAPATRERSPQSREFHPPEAAPEASAESQAEAAGGGNPGAGESPPKSSESPSQSSESAPSSEPAPSSEAPAQPAGESPPAEESPPVVSGGS